MTAIINPFYQRRTARITAPQAARPPSYARLPQTPITASPVPHLTSLYHFHGAGEYGDRSYPGNCGGNLIKDLLRFFSPPGLISAPRSASGACADVCRELGLPCLSWDIHQGLDACDQHFPGADTFAFL